MNVTNQHNSKKDEDMMLLLTSSLFFLHISSYTGSNFTYTIISIRGEFSADKTVWITESMDYMFYCGLVNLREQCEEIRIFLVRISTHRTSDWFYFEGMLS